VLEVLKCYQNPDGGFGHGLEPDVMSPASTAICTEVAMAYLDGLGVTDGPMVDDMMHWIDDALQADGSILHPVADVLAYPHGEWFEDDSGSALTLAGFLGKWGKGTADFFSRADKAFVARERPAELAKYHYDLYIYLRYSPGAARHGAALKRIRDMIPSMLEKWADHFPLFVFPTRWYSEEFDQDFARRRADAAVAALSEDGGLKTPYDHLPWWRPIWTLQLLISLQQCGFIE
jgi:hypothetical protein